MIAAAAQSESGMRDVGLTSPTPTLEPPPNAFQPRRKVACLSGIHRLSSTSLCVDSQRYHTPQNDSYTLAARTLQQRGLQLVQASAWDETGSSWATTAAAALRRSISACWPPASVTATTPGLTTATFSSACRRCLPGRARNSFSPCCPTSGSRAEPHPPSRFAMLRPPLLRVPPDAYRMSAPRWREKSSTATEGHLRRVCCQPAC